MKRTPKSIYNDEEGDDPLQKQLKSLEEEWDYIKQSISRSNRRNPTTTVHVEHRLFHLYGNSPKELMSLLQHENSPSRPHDRAAIEIIEERETYFNNRRFRGRRLFEESEVGSDDGESEVCTEFSYKGPESHDGNYNQVCRFKRLESPPSDVAGLEVVAVVAVKSGGGAGGGRWMICIVVMVFALVIFAFKCSGEDEKILIPT